MTTAEIKRIAIEVVKLMKKERLIEEQPERLLTLKEAAEMLKLTPKSFYNHKEARRQDIVQAKRRNGIHQ